MSWVPDRAAGGAAPGRRVPAGQRPTWMVVLASLMVVVAYHLIQDGMSVLVDGPSRLAGPPVEPGPGDDRASALALRRGIVLALERMDPRLTRGFAASKLVIGALMLFAIAGIATNDRLARRGTLVAAWAGIPYHVGFALFYGLFLRGEMFQVSSEWIPYLKHMESTLPRGTTVARIMNQILVIFPVGVALLGVGFSVVLIAYFGGNRGRAFYGLPPRGAPGAGGGV